MKVEVTVYAVRYDRSDRQLALLRHSVDMVSFVSTIKDLDQDMYTFLLLLVTRSDIKFMCQPLSS